MKLDKRETQILRGVLAECREAREPRIYTGRDYRRLRIEERHAGVIPMNAAKWIGHRPTPSESVMLCRCYARLEAAGLVVCVKGESGRTIALRLTPEGIQAAS